MFETWKKRIGWGRLSEQEFRSRQAEILAKAPVPVFWMFGKTGSGKTSIVKFLTGAAEAQIGTGYKPQTRFSQQYDFPSAENPVMRFLDTRGLGESRYDPAEDIREFTASTHLVLVTVRVMDHALDSVVVPLKEIRAAAPERPVILALTCLHHAYPQRQHPHPDPFDAPERSSDLPDELKRSLEAQQQRFAGLVDVVVPIDFTKPEDGFEEQHFGGARLKAALLDALPSACREALLRFDAAMKPLKDLREQRAMPFIIGHSTMAASAAAVPLPWVDIPAVLAIQSHMVYRLARIYDQQMNTRNWTQLAGSISGRVLGRMLVRESLKLIPVVGMAANAALAFTYTYAAGKAWCWYFGEVRRGNAPSEKELEQMWRGQISAAAELWKRSREGELNP